MRAKVLKYPGSKWNIATQLATIIKSRAKIMISGYESDLYNKYLTSWKKEYLKSSAEHNGTRQEVVWMNYEYYSQLSMDL